MWCSSNLQVDSQTDSSPGTLYVHSLALQTPTCDVPRDGGAIFCCVFVCCIFFGRVCGTLMKLFCVPIISQNDGQKERMIGRR